VTLDRAHTLRGKRNLDWFFANRRWLRLPDRLLHVAYAIRPLPEAERAIQFLLIAAKRDMKRAHDRNRSKRWLRAALTNTVQLSELEIEMMARSQQLLVMIRVSSPPSSTNFANVSAATSTAIAQLLKVARQS
jgi:ribonuclease P protein component